MIRTTLTLGALILGIGVANALPVPLDGQGFIAAPVLVASQASEEREPGPADLEEAIEIALERYGGRAAGAETVVRDGRLVHEIRVLGEDGSVRTVRIDPDTGAFIPPRR